MEKLYFLTGNSNKVREAQEILGIEIEQVAIDLDEPQTVEVESVIDYKARQAYSKLQHPVIVEDTGLSLNAWNGLPGALIKWFLERIGNEGLIKMLQPFDDRSAKAVTIVGFFDGSRLVVARGEVSGTISTEVLGENGFGWDKIFIPEGYNRTFAQMDKEEKNLISMRRRAFDQLKQLL
ncbi:MAG: RdgB/HAM1 family non-canonical purine NTP pyrophosphatase [Blastocatellia bacterium]|nr:RdgB/HAM1 family non-canonical purine NTP pyrophosphatase [Blastocatellia bacterium]